ASTRPRALNPSPAQRPRLDWECYMARSRLRSSLFRPFLRIAVAASLLTAGLVTVTASPASATCLVDGQWIGSWQSTLDASPHTAYAGWVESSLDLVTLGNGNVQIEGHITFTTGTTVILNNLPITADPASPAAGGCNTITNGKVGNPANPTITFNA